LKRHLLTCGILACALFIQAQNGLAYSNVHEGCTTCHLKAKVHEVASHTTCINCHTTDSPPQGAQDVAPAKCVVCHPTGNPGKCGLVKKHVKLMKNCASCHGTTLSISGFETSNPHPACTSCHTDCTSVCPAAKVLGEEDPRLTTLRGFRDNVLSKSALGRQVISLYYTNAQAINAALESHPKLKAFAHKALESFIPVAENFMKSAF
jgi:hypothetical protein